MNILKRWLPTISAALALGIDYALPNASSKYEAAHPYLRYLLICLIVLYCVYALAAFWSRRARDWIDRKALFAGAVILVLNIYNVVSKKYSLIPTIYFPSVDRILAVIVEDRSFLLSCFLSSGKLLLTGFLSGFAAGFITGIVVGFSKWGNYWIMPVVRTIGPIPATAWIPIVLVAFPSSFAASAFLIGLSVWFPMTVMTSSGISNVQNSYFEVSSTLGAKKWHQMFKVGIPAAMPHMFIGIFNGACSSFIALMTAEMLGVKNGLGWYVNWQKEMLAYSNVYAGLLIIVVTFSLLTTLLFRFRDHVLQWQKGVIKW